MRKPRFNPEDLQKIEVEFTAIKAHLTRLRNLMLEANLRHTKDGFYDSRLRRVTDRLPRTLHALDDLLWNERMRHSVDDVRPASGEVRRCEVNA